MEVHGRVALVTGASSGVGRAVASRLADAGAHVVVHGRDQKRSEELARSLRGSWILGDLSEPGAAEALASEALSRFPAVDLLVASAGFGWSGPLTQMPVVGIDEMVTVDLTAPMMLARLLVPPMVDRGAGHVVLISSIAGRTGVAGEAVYAACKAGLDAFAESLRLELVGTGVGVSVVVPGAVRTSFFDHRGRPYGRRIPRPVAADTVAATVMAMIRRDRAEAWVPRWLRAAAMMRSVAPGGYRRLAARYGEQVRARPFGPGRTR